MMGWGALGCSNLTASGARGGVARDVTSPNLTCDMNNLKKIQKNSKKMRS